MRIISKYKDFYDGVQSYGQDPTLVYNRSRVVYEKNDPNQNRGKGFQRNKDSKILSKNMELTIVPLINVIEKFPDHINLGDAVGTIKIFCGIIGFCGIFIPILKINNYAIYKLDDFKNKNIMESMYPNYLRYNKRFLKLLLEKVFSNEESYNGGYLNKNTWNNPPHINPNDEPFIALQSPVFYITSTAGYNCYDIIINPVLKDLNFQRIKSPWETFQEISMYLGNQLATKKDPVIRVSDEIMRDKKGFDKWSFKTMPSKIK